MRHESGRRVDRQRGDLLGRLVRHVLDAHPAFGRNHECDAAARPVDQQREIVLAGDVDPVGHVEPIDLLARGAGLHRDQRVAEHLAGVGLDLVERLRQPDPAFGVGAELLELALAAPAGVDLRLDDVQRSRQSLGALDGFLDRAGRMAGGDRDAEVREQLLGLVFMDVHRGSAFGTSRNEDAGA